MIRSECQYLVPTLKETPADAEIVSHQLMVRAGMIRKLSAGLYTYMPLCLRVIRKVETIIREEMDKRKAQELLMPFLQPGELWQRSGRWETMGPEMVRVKNRQDKDFVLSPTHEEVITDLVGKELRSYRHLPGLFYQIATKVRDEIRPRFGVMRCREFIMKDAYSFHADEQSLASTYEDMYEAYSQIFRRCGIPARAVQADSGMMGGSASAEFMVMAESGEDLIAYCDSCDYAANVEKATSLKSAKDAPAQEFQEMDTVSTPNVKTIADVSSFLKMDSQKMIKTLFYMADGNLVCVLSQGEDQINETKLKNYLQAQELFMPSDDHVQNLVSTVVGFSGPVGLSSVRIIADAKVPAIVNGVTGANTKDEHLVNVNFGRDYSTEEVLDLALVRQGELCAQCTKGHLKIDRGIEVGHIFKLGTKYSESLGAKYLDPKDKEQNMIMGCYGIGVSRTVAAIIECNHDQNGIVWPAAVAPFAVCVVPVNAEDQQVSEVALNVYKTLSDLGIETLLDDRSERPGFKFKDADLLGLPVRVIVSRKHLANGQLEVKNRKTGEILFLDQNDYSAKIEQILQSYDKENVA